MSAKPKSHDEYLATVRDDQRAALAQLRKTIKAAAPKSEEFMSYGICAFRQNGVLVGYGATAKHCSFFLMSGTTVAAHKQLLADYETSKGAIRFQPENPLPAGLVRKLVKVRIAENQG